MNSPEPREQAVTPVTGDLISGAGEIAAFLYGDRNRVRSIYRLAETTSIPVFKVGAQLSARRSRLTEWLARLESEAASQGSLLRRWAGAGSRPTGRMVRAGSMQVRTKCLRRIRPRAIAGTIPTTGPTL